VGSETVTIVDSSADGATSPSGIRDLKIINILGHIEPVFGNAFGVGVQLQPDERVTGVSINGESHAYPLNLMSRHEVVYDTVGGEPIAVTW